MASARSFVLTANAASTLAILLTILLESKADLLNVFIAAVKDCTADSASIPERRVKIIASLVRFNVSSIFKPWRESSFAAVATV